MANRSRAVLVGATAALLLILALLVGGGVLVRGYITQAFEETQTLRQALSLTRLALAGQLDEETGVRGYSSTQQRLYLAPYDAARRTLPGVLQRLHARLDAVGLGDAAQLAIDAAATNRGWLATVAVPLTRSAHSADANAMQLQGKYLVDHFRSDIDGITKAITARTSDVERTVRASIDRINVLVGATAVIIVAIGSGFLEWQRRTAVRLEREREQAEIRQREAESLRAAYVAEKRIADSLQDAIAQRPLPILPTLRFSATYVPATEEAKVGGDWYEALELPNDRVLFAIGDVTGHGIDAAVTMNRTRQALISSALLKADPGDVLSRVNDELFAQSAPLVTAVAGYADAGTYEFVYATAGHPPPLLIEPGRPPRLLPCGSLPLGAMPHTQYAVHRIQSVPGATLVLYTDGAVEHSRNVIEGEELLLAAAAGAAEHNAVDTASFIHKAIFQGRPVGDDVAILTVGFATDASNGVRISADDAQSAFAGRLGRVGSVGPRMRGSVRELPLREVAA